MRSILTLSRNVISKIWNALSMAVPLYYMIRVLKNPLFLFPAQPLWWWNYNSVWKAPAQLIKLTLWCVCVCLCEGVGLTCWSSKCRDETNTECAWLSFISWRSGWDQKTQNPNIKLKEWELWDMRTAWHLFRYTLFSIDNAYSRL